MDVCPLSISVIKYKRINDDLFKEKSNNVLKYRTLCTHILNCEFQVK